MKIHLSEYALGAIERRLFECQAKEYELELTIKLHDEMTAEQRESKQNQLAELQEIKKQLEHDIEVWKHLKTINKIDIVKLINE
jgi:hypothetical protein